MPLLTFVLKSEKVLNFVDMENEFFEAYMSSVLIVVTPIARQCSFPSAMIATTVPLSTGFIKAPEEESIRKTFEMI